MEDYYCECGQYLTKYLVALGQCANKTVTLAGVPCPSKGCNKTYSIELTKGNDENRDIVLLRS